MLGDIVYDSDAKHNQILLSPILRHRMGFRIPVVPLSDGNFVGELMGPQGHTGTACTTRGSALGRVTATGSTGDRLELDYPRASASVYQ